MCCLCIIRRAEEAVQECVDNCTQAIKDALVSLCESLYKACKVCICCCECLLTLCSCFSCIVRPFVFGLRFFGLQTQLDYAKALLLFVLCWVKDCVQFWTPLSVTYLLLWLIYRPGLFHPFVGDAALAALDLTHGVHGNSSANANASLLHLHYDLSVDLGFRNSRGLSIRYLDVGATAFYNGTALGSAVNSLPSFRQPPKNTTLRLLEPHPAFQGTVAALSGEVAAQLGTERAAGALHVRVGVDVTLMYRVWFVKNIVFHKYDCWLWFPPPRKGAPALFHGDGAQCWRVRH